MPVQLFRVRDNFLNRGNVTTVYFYSKTKEMHISNLFYFRTTLYMCRTVFPSIIRSLRLYIQHQVTSYRFCGCLLAGNLLLFSHMFLHQNPVYTSALPHTCYMPAYLILLDSITRIIFGEDHKSLSSSLGSFFHSPVT
jgi:hypothetical protein